jgi:hypothetical protein
VQGRRDAALKHSSSASSSSLVLSVKMWWGGEAVARSGGGEAGAGARGVAVARPQGGTTETACLASSPGRTKRGRVKGARPSMRAWEGRAARCGAQGGARGGRAQGDAGGHDGSTRRRGGAGGRQGARQMGEALKGGRWGMLEGDRARARLMCVGC